MLRIAFITLAVAGILAVASSSTNDALLLGGDPIVQPADWEHATGGWWNWLKKLLDCFRDLRPDDCPLLPTV